MNQNLVVTLAMNAGIVHMHKTMLKRLGIKIDLQVGTIFQVHVTENELWLPWANEGTK